MGTRIDGEFGNNVHAEWSQLALPIRFDYRIKAGSSLIGQFSPPGTANGIDLSPKSEYMHPANTRPLPAVPRLPGALQTLSSN